MITLTLHHDLTAAAAIWFEIWGLWIRVKKSIFPGKFSKIFDFFRQFHQKIRFFQAIPQKISIFPGKFPKNFDFSGKFTKKFDFSRKHLP